MEIWHIWAVLALLFVIIEVFTTGFAVFCFAVGAAAAAVASVLGFGLLFQLLWFSVGSFVAFVVARPLLLKSVFRADHPRQSGADALAGRRVLVMEDIDGELGGLVAVDGDVWKAVSADGRVVPAGEVVQVERLLDSVTLVVK